MIPDGSSWSDMEHRRQIDVLRTRVYKLEQSREAAQGWGCSFVAATVVMTVIDWWRGWPVLHAVLRPWTVP